MKEDFEPKKEVDMSAKNENVVPKETGKEVTIIEEEEELKDNGKIVKRDKILWYGCDICHCNVYDIYYSYENNGQCFVVHPQCLSNDVLPAKYTKVNSQIQASSSSQQLGMHS